MTEPLPKVNDSLTGRYEPINVNQKHKQNLGFQERVAAAITGAVGTMYAAGWMLWQTITEKPFDPYPFAFMVFISNIVQLLLLPLLMVGQNVQDRHAQLRAEEEYKMTKSLNKDMEEILERLEKIEKRVKN
jgi:uncharacterized membrane protein